MDFVVILAKTLVLVLSVMVIVGSLGGLNYAALVFFGAESKKNYIEAAVLAVLWSTAIAIAGWMIFGFVINA